MNSEILNGYYVLLTLTNEKEYGIYLTNKKYEDFRIWINSDDNTRFKIKTDTNRVSEDSLYIHKEEIRSYKINKVTKLDKLLCNLKYLFLAPSNTLFNSYKYIKLIILSIIMYSIYAYYKAPYLGVKFNELILTSGYIDSIKNFIFLISSFFIVIYIILFISRFVGLLIEDDIKILDYGYSKKLKINNLLLVDLLFTMFLPILIK